MPNVTVVILSELMISRRGNISNTVLPIENEVRNTSRKLREPDGELNQMVAPRAINSLPEISKTDCKLKAFSKSVHIHSIN